MWNGTKTLAENIAKGIKDADTDTIVKVFNLAKTDENDLVTEVFKSKLIVLGSPTMSNTVLHSDAGFIHILKQMRFKDKKAASFGCYGWSGESVKVLNGLLSDAGFEVITDGLKNLWNPDEDAKKAAQEFGKSLVKQ